jgi:RimJ/RimL family protein N-acetyltransferase
VSAALRVLVTPRLMLREFTLGDAAFVLELLNEPGFLRNIGDKGVRTREDARHYLQRGPIDSYGSNGFGLYAACLLDAEDAEPIGMCGLVKREGLPDPDVGYAFLERHWGRGYAVESAAAALEYGMRTLELPRILAITSPDNRGSIRVLEKIGMKFERLIRLTGGGDEVQLFSRVADGTRR